LGHDKGEFIDKVKQKKGKRGMVVKKNVETLKEVNDLKEPNPCQEGDGKVRKGEAEKITKQRIHLFSFVEKLSFWAL
jgi:hypothetical protein